MPFPVRPSLIFLLSALLLAGCGGVARNPSEPQFPGRGNPQSGAPGAPTGQAADGRGTVPPEQDPNLAGANTPAEFRDRAQVALIQGNLQTAVNGYTMMVERKNDDPEAVLALAITTLWRDMELFAPFTAPELPLTFLNTPLTLIPTLVPQPLAQDDGYFWRLLALGVDSQPGLNPQAILADFLREAGADVRPQPGGTPAGGLIPAGGLRPGPRGDALPDGKGEEEAKAKEEEQRQNEGRAGRPAGGEDVRRGSALVEEPEERSGQQGGRLSEEQQKSLQEALQQQSGGDSGEQQRQSGGAPNPTAGGTGSNDPAVLLSQTQYQNFETDRPGQDLLPKLRMYLRQRSALNFTWEGRQTRLATLRQTLTSLLTGLDRTRQQAGEDFHLELPVMLGSKDRPEIFQIAFEKPDYDMIRAQLKLFLWLLDYRSQYTTAGQWNFLVPPQDADADGALSPAEYYPPPPFGTLTEAAREQLSRMKGQLGDVLRDCNDAAQSYRDAEVYTRSGKNYHLPRGKEPALERVLLDEASRMLEVAIALPQEKARVGLHYTRDVEQLEISYAPLFDGSLSDVRTLLPAFDLASGQPVSEGGAAAVLPDVLPEGQSWAPWLQRHYNLEGAIVRSGTPLGKATVAAGSLSAQTADLTGLFSLNDLMVYPHIGVAVAISGANITEPVTVNVRTPNLLWDVTLPVKHGGNGAATPPTGESVVEDEGGRSGILGGIRTVAPGDAQKAGGEDEITDEDGGSKAEEEAERKQKELEEQRTREEEQEAGR